MRIVKIESKEHLEQLIREYDDKGYHMASGCAVPRFFLISDDGLYSLHSEEWKDENSR